MASATLSQSAFNPPHGGRRNLGNCTISAPRLFQSALMALAGCHVQWIHELGTEATERQTRHSNIRTAIFVDVLKQYGVAAVRLQKANSCTGALSDHQTLIPLIFTLI